MAKANGGYRGQQQQQAPPQQQQQPARKPPVAEFRMSLVKIAAWENERQDGGTRLSFSLTRSYKDGNGQWQSAGTLSLNREDLALVMEVCRQAMVFGYGPKENREPGQDG